MYSLIVYLIITGQVQTIQIDGFSSKDKCQEAYNSMLPLYVDINTEFYSFCLLKD